MRRTLFWLPAAVQDLLAIADIDDASAVDAAAQLFADTGQGFLRRVVHDDGPTSGASMCRALRTT